MTAGELLRALENYDPEAEVVIIDVDGHYYTPTEVWRGTNGEVVVE